MVLLSGRKVPHGGGVARNRQSFLGASVATVDELVRRNEAAVVAAVAGLKAPGDDIDQAVHVLAMTTELRSMAL